MFNASYRLLLLTFAVTIFFSSICLAAEDGNPSLDKLIDQIDEIVGGGLDPESFEAKCSDDALACNDEELCVRAINTINPRYKDEVKRRGMKCGISDVVSTCTVSDPSGCSEAFICKRATYDIEGAKNWSLSTKYVNEAKKRELDCGVIDNEQLSDNYLWPDWKICSHSIYQDIWETRQKYAPHVAEAKRRGLDCGVSSNQSAGSDNSVKLNAYYCKDDPDACTDDQLCFVASSEGIWLENSKPNHVLAAKARNLTCNTEAQLVVGACKRGNVGACNTEELCKNATSFNLTTGKIYWLSNNYIQFVNEARKRRINCGVGTLSPSFNKSSNTDPINSSYCKQNPKVCSSDELCKKATYNGPSGGKVWSALYENFVSEAKRRGLSCGVTAKNITKVAKVTLESYFKAQTLTKRKQIQYALSSRSYYNKAIDGKWGAGTKNAVNEFLFFHKNLEDQQVALIYDSILDLVDKMPTSFDNAKKKSASSNSKSSSNKTTTNKKSDEDSAAEAAAVCALELGAAIATGGLSLLFNDGCLF